MVCRRDKTGLGVGTMSQVAGFSVKSHTSTINLVTVVGKTPGKLCGRWSEFGLVVTVITIVF